MLLDVLLEKIGENGYRATWPGPLPESADGPTRDEALSRLRMQIHERLRQASVEPSSSTSGRSSTRRRSSSGYGTQKTLSSRSTSAS